MDLSNARKIRAGDMTIARLTLLLMPTSFGQQVMPHKKKDNLARATAWGALEKKTLLLTFAKKMVHTDRRILCIAAKDAGPAENC